MSNRILTYKNWQKYQQEKETAIAAAEAEARKKADPLGYAMSESVKMAKTPIERWKMSTGEIAPINQKFTTVASKDYIPEAAKLNKMWEEYKANKKPVLYSLNDLSDEEKAEIDRLALEYATEQINIQRFKRNNPNNSVNIIPQNDKNFEKIVAEKKRELLEERYDMSAIMKDAVTQADENRGYSKNLYQGSDQAEAMQLKKYLTPTEENDYARTYVEQGREAADQYLFDKYAELSGRKSQETQSQLQEFSEDHPWLGSAASVGTNLLSTLETVGNAARYLNTGRAKRSYFADMTTAFRQGVSNKIDWNIGNWDAFDFLYNTGMSAVDSLAVSWAGGYGAAALGLAAAGQATNDILNRGGSNDQAFWGGVVSGAFEAIFEKFSIGNFNKLKEVSPKTFKDVLLNIAKSMEVNASEEAATETANILWDTFVNGDISNAQILIKEYMEQGITESEAKARVALDLGLQIAEAAGSGALMGVGFGSGGNVLGYAYNKANNAVLKTTNAVSNPLESYSPEKQNSIKEFISAVDEKIKSFVQSVKSGDTKFRREKISDVSEKAAADIKSMLGIDVSGYTHNINTNGVEHILKRHGENGVHDHTMSSDDDIARIGWVLENYDNVEVLTEADTQVVSTEFRDSNNNPAPQIRFTKKIDGTYYVVEAAFENNHKKLWVQSAYLQKNNEDVTQAPDTDNKISPEMTAKTALASPSSNNSIPNSPNIVKENSPLPEVSAENAETDMAQSLINDALGIENLSEGQKTLRKIGKAFGVEIGFKNLDEWRTDDNSKRYLFSPDGEYDPNTGKITLNTSKRVKHSPVAYILKHELTHSLEKNGILYNDFADAVMESTAFKNYIKEKGFNTAAEYNADIVRRYTEKGIKNFDEGKADLEMVANFVGDMLFGGRTEITSTLIEGMQPKPKRSFTQWIKDTLSYFKQKLTGQKVYVDEITQLEEKFLKTVRSAQAKENTAQQDGGEKQNSISDNFYDEFDAWDGKDTNKVFTIGTTSEPLQSVNIKNQEIKMRSGMIIQKLNKHPEMSRQIFRDIPELLEHPIIIQFSDAIDPKTQKPKYDSRITVLGELYADMNIDGKMVKKPVLVSLELLPTNQKKTKILDVSFVTSAYGHSKLQAYLNENSILYIEPNKKRTNNWLSLNRLQLPLGENRTGPIRKITYTDGKVKIQNSTKKTEMQIALEKAGVINSYGNSIFQNDENNSEDKQFSLTETTDADSLYNQTKVENYTETQYNNFGWVRYNEVLTASEYTTLLSRYADFKHNKDKYPVTRFGEAVIHSSECPDVIMYVKGPIRSPQITKIVRIMANEDWAIPFIEEEILKNENEQNLQPFKTVEDYFGYGILDISKARDYASFREYRAEQERGSSKGSDTLGRTEQDRAGGAAKGDRVYNADDGVKYSLSDFSAEEMLVQYENGEITRDEYLEWLKGERVLNPLEIGRMTKEDASTTPPMSRQQGENEGDSESKTYRSLQKSDIFDEEFKDEVKNDEFIKQYQSITNKETLVKAAKELDEGGQSYLNQWNNIEPERASLMDITVGLILMYRYQRVGDTQSAIAAAQKVRKMGTASGRQVQIFSILGRFDPATMIAYAQKELDDAFEALVDGKSQKWIDKYKERLKLTDEDIDYIRRKTLQAARLEEGTRAKAIVLAQIAARIQDKIPANVGDKLRTLQRVSMLLNPKTNVRNITGNAGMVPIFIASDFFGTMIDKRIAKKTETRTTGNFTLKGSGTAFKKGLSESWEDFKRGIRTRMDDLNRFDVNKSGGKVFDDGHGGKLAKQLNALSKKLNEIDNFTSFCLEAGDRSFFEMWMNNSLNNQLQLNNVEIPTPEMLEIARQEALQRTWQDDNKFTRTVGQIKRSLNGVHIPGTNYGLGDFVLKFVKTPSNIAKAIVDFSPMGFALSVPKLIKMKNSIETGRFTPQMQKEAVRSLSNAITGTLVYALVAVLAAAGAIELSGAGDEDKDAANFEKYVAGIAPYSINFFGTNISYDWMQPFGSVLAVVADFMENRRDNPYGNVIDDIFSALQVGGQAFTEQSFLSSLYELFSSDGIIEGLVSAGFSEPAAFVPQVFSQAASFTDNKRRVTYDPTSEFKTAWNRVIVKIPGLRQTLPEQVNVLGESVNNNQFLNPWEAFVAPGNSYSKSSGKVADSIYELYKSTGNKAVMPKVSPNYISVKGNKITFTPEEKAEYQKTTGTLSAEILAKMFTMSEYKALTDEEKADAVKEVYNYATAMAKCEIEYSYEVLSAMEGTTQSGTPYLTKAEYNSLSKGARKQMAREYFLTKAERQLGDDPAKAAKYFISRAKN